MSDKSIKKDEKQIKPGHIIAFVIMIALSMCVGVIAGKFMSNDAGSADEQVDMVHKLLRAGVIIVTITAAFFLSLIIHEGGHLIFGLMTGYKFLSFRVGSLTLVKQPDGRFCFKKFSIAGTGGQCLLMPPEGDPQKVPFFLYHLGGGLFNLITAAICLPTGLSATNTYAREILVIFGAISVFQGLTNLIPLKLQVPNDGYNLLMMSRNPADREAIYKSLRYNGLLCEGHRPTEIPYDLCEFGGTFYELFSKQLKGAERLDAHDFEKAAEYFTDCMIDNKIEIYALECCSELIFCKLMTGAPAEVIDELYDKKLANYIKAAGKTQIGKRRLMYAYYLIYKRDSAAAQAEYDAAMKLKETYPIPGELATELDLIEYVKENADRLTAEREAL